MNYKIKKISGDASFRVFFRLKKGKNSSIIVRADKEKHKNLISYLVINNVLIKNGICAPKLINDYYGHNMIEISDLGDAIDEIQDAQDEFKGQIHGFLTMGAKISDTSKLITLVCDRINDSFY